MLGSIGLLSAIPSVLAAGNFGAQLGTVESDLNNLESKIDSMTSSTGYGGVLGIQQSYPALLQSVNSLQSAASGLTDSEVQPQQIISLVNSVSSLLQLMVAKQPEFQRLGVARISANDIEQLQQPTVSIITSIINAAGSDCNKIREVTPSASKIAQAFTQAAKAYDFQAAQFPSPKPCTPEHKQRFESSSDGEVTQMVQSALHSAHNHTNIVATSAHRINGTKSANSTSSRNSVHTGSVAIGAKTNKSSAAVSQDVDFLPEMSNGASQFKLPIAGITGSVFLAAFYLLN